MHRLQTTWHEYLSAGGGLVGEHFTKTGTVTDTYTYFFVTDHLGSVAVITDELGTVTERLSYDAWGKRRESDGDDSPIQIVSATTLGFTGHEMIDDVGLVNMNGRIYDPTIGRFLSADPFIQDVTNSQNLNRYTYVNNNPLSYTDPSGFFFKKLFKAIKKVFKAVVSFVKKFWRAIVAIAAAVTLQFYVLPGLLGLPTGFSAFSSFLLPTKVFIAGISAGVSNVIATGRARSFLTGFAQGAALAGIGHALGVAPPKGAPFSDKASFFAKKAVLHGVVGGVVSEVEGGKFSAGFAAAGFSALASAKSFGNVVAGTAYHAVAGGIGSVLGGGKFANGAVTGAFGYLFNELGSYFDPDEAPIWKAAEYKDGNLIIDDNHEFEAYWKEVPIGKFVGGANKLAKDKLLGKSGGKLAGSYTLEYEVVPTEQAILYKEYKTEYLVDSEVMNRTGAIKVNEYYDAKLVETGESKWIGTGRNKSERLTGNIRHCYGKICTDDGRIFEK